jgi:hypothetical protein
MSGGMAAVFLDRDREITFKAKDGLQQLLKIIPQ